MKALRVTPKTMIRSAKVAVAVLCGLLVGVLAAGIHLLLLPLDRPIIVHAVVGDVVAGLIAVVVCLAIQLRQEEIHYQSAIERAAIVAELNHHIRNAVFPLSLAIHKTADPDAIATAQDSVERINIALKDATVDALSGRTRYRNDGALSGAGAE
jgi:hypothetical protein